MQDKISYKVLKHEELPFSVWYRVACVDIEDGHMLDIEFEYDKDTPGYIYINFHKKLAWCSQWGPTNWYQSFWKRLKCSMKMFFTGYIEVEESLILNGEKHIDSFITALNEGKQHILDYQKEQMKKDNKSLEGKDKC